ncbi:MAG: VCBS repeat-containing protein [Saprospirales bacterium]|nr:VCBS repeat-containing protein [Saprospirales bacterium]
MPDTTWNTQTIAIANPYVNYLGACQDMDGDGDLDVLSSPNPDNWIVYYKNPDWEETLIHTQGDLFSYITVAGDVDGDGDLDVPYGGSGYATQALGWAENPGPSGDWTAHDITPLVDYQQIPTGLADIDGDEDSDLVALEFFPNLGTGAAIWVENPILSNAHTLPPIPANAVLSASPNPFSGSTIIQYQLLEPGEIELALFSRSGEKLRVLDEGEKAIGEYTTPLGGIPPGLSLNGKQSFLKLVHINN